MHTTKQELAAINVITDRKSFVDIQSKGKKWVSRSLVLRVKENNSEGVRVGYTISKRVDKSAVRRNRVKRRLRAVAAGVLSKYAKDNVDYVILARKETISSPYNSIINDLKWCLKRMGYYIG